MRSAVPGLPAEGEKVTTACGGAIEFTADTPRTLFQNRWLFFLPAGLPRPIRTQPGGFLSGRSPNLAE